jgi:hypothetical protein
MAPSGSTTTGDLGTVHFSSSDGHIVLPGETTLHSISGTATVAVSAAPPADSQPESGLLDRAGSGLSRLDVDQFFTLDPFQQDVAFSDRRCER